MNEAPQQKNLNEELLALNFLDSIVQNVSLTRKQHEDASKCLNLIRQRLITDNKIIATLSKKEA